MGNKLFSFGNRKLPNDIAIFNMTSATNCPSLKKNMCPLNQSKDCYALKCEKRWPKVKPYRDRQTEYWDSVSAEKFAENFLNMIKKKK